MDKRELQKVLFNILKLNENNEKAKINEYVINLIFDLALNG